MNKKKTLFKITMLVLVLGLFQNLAAQNTQEKKPDWIQMMNNPEVNYFDAVSNFNGYWKNKEKPEEEAELFAAKDAKTRKRNEGVITYSFEYKKFVLWQRTNLAFVKKDGTLLTREERLAAWEKEKKARN